jgi:xanthine dehydrogenase accessory factor
VGVNCDVAIETRPATSGTIVMHGKTEAADGMAPLLGGIGKERFVYSGREGRWHTPIEIGMRVFKGFVVGHLDGATVHAPIDGRVRGIVRDATRVPQGVKLLEIDPRGARAKWTGIDERGRAIGQATLKAMRLYAAESERLEALIGPYRS